MLFGFRDFASVLRGSVSLLPRPLSPNVRRYCRMSRKLLLTVAVMLAVVLGSGMCLRVLLWPNRAVVRNGSGRELRGIRLLLRDLDGRIFLDKVVPRLGPGEAVMFRHDRNDSRAELRFTLTGEERRHEEPYTIDLWRGEGWALEVKPDGSVRGYYDYPRSE